MKEQPLTWFTDRINRHIDRYVPIDGFYLRSTEIVVLDQEHAKHLHDRQSNPEYLHRYADNLFSNPLTNP